MLGDMRRIVWTAAAALLALASACRPRGGCSGDYCGTLVVALTGEPDVLLPPITEQSESQAVLDQIFLKLADLDTTLNTFGDSAFTPLIARSWEWADPKTLVFHIDPRARWQDGTPVTATDVAFSYDAYVDPKVNSPYAGSLHQISAVTARDSLTAVFRFRQHYPEMFYDAVGALRVLPAHILRGVPREQWATAAFGHQPVGDGPYRFQEWKPGDHIELAADSTFFLGRPHIRRLIFRFTSNQQVAVSQTIAGDADMISFLGPPDVVARARAAPQLALYPYRGSVHTDLVFNFVDPADTTRPHPLFAERDVRRALAMSVDRARLLQSVFGNLARVPPGPMTPMWWIWDTTLAQTKYDTTGARWLLERQGWRDSDGDGIRDKNGVKLSFHLLVPTTSGLRRQYARLLQDQFRKVGAEVQIDEVEPNVLDTRARTGQFDAVLASWNTDPSPSSGIAQTWTREGFGRSNWGRYYNADFERFLAQAESSKTRPQAARAWRGAMQVLNSDAAGIWLYAPDNIAAVHRRVAGVVIRPDAWWALIRLWRIPGDRLIARDRLER